MRDKCIVLPELPGTGKFLFQTVLFLGTFFSQLQNSTFLDRQHKPLFILQPLTNTCSFNFFINSRFHSLSSIFSHRKLTLSPKLLTHTDPS